jgi:hypothetical protein
VTESVDESERLTVLLRAVAFREPGPDLLAGARRRYLEALDARYRREAVTGFVTASLALVLAAAALSWTFEPAAIVAWLASAVASVATWADGLTVVAGDVSPAAWVVTVLASVVSLLSVIALRRAPFTAPVK